MIRWRPPGVVALSVFDLPLPDGRQLWQVAGVRGGRADEIVDALLHVASQLALDHAFARLRLAGGLTERTGFAEAVAVAASPWPIEIAPGGAFAACVAAAPDDDTLVVDVGQTAIKAARGPGRVSSSRPASLPVRLIGDGPVTPGVAAAAARAAADWIHAATEPLRAPPAHHALLALPCPLDDTLTLGPCTFGWADQPLPALDLSPNTRVCQDAELAALHTPPATLTFTLGFGPGAALTT